MTAPTFPQLHQPQSAPVPMMDLTRQHASIAAEVEAATIDLIRSQKFILGEAVSDFETSVARYCDSVSAVGCASGTDALVLALMGLGIGPGDEVITSPFSFFATASTIARVGARPVFADIDPVTFNLDPAAVEAAITPRTRAIMPVHLFGQCSDMEPLWRLATRHSLSIIEDACQAIGASYQGRKAGVLGTVGCFSFFPTKNLGGAGDGGLVTTDNSDLAKRMSRLRVHGDVGRYEHVDLGLNSRLDALQAVILNIKLRYLDQWIDSRRANAAHYQQIFSEYAGEEVLTLPTESAGCHHTYNQYVVRVLGQQRDAALESLKQRQVGSAVYYPKPLHLQTCFAYLGYRAGQFPQSERACAEVLALPVFPELTWDEVETAGHALASGLGLARSTATKAAPRRKAA